MSYRTAGNLSPIFSEGAVMRDARVSLLHQLPTSDTSHQGSVGF